jgi:hypothetical protein
MTLVEETNAYVPSNCVVAAGGDAVCASAATTNPNNPTIHNHPMCFCMYLLPTFGGIYFSRLGTRFGTGRIIAQVIVIPAEAGIQGNRCGLAGLDSRFRGNDESSAQPLSLILPGCFLPDEIVAARVAELADASGAGGLNRSADAQIDGLVRPATGPNRSHCQLALRPDRSSDPVACGGGVVRLPVQNVQRTRSPVRTWPRLPFPRRVGCIYQRGGNRPICTVERRSGHRRRRRLRICGSE